MSELTDMEQQTLMAHFAARAIPPKQLKVDMSVEARQLLNDTRELFGGHVEPSDDLGAVR